MPAQDPEDNSKLKRRHVGIFHAKKVAGILKLQKKLGGIINDPPTSMLDQHVNLVTTSRTIIILIERQ